MENELAELRRFIAWLDEQWPETAAARIARAEVKSEAWKAIASLTVAQLRTV